MGLEIANNIAQLQSVNPDKSDVMHEGDDHIRLIKSVLKVVFAGEPAADGTPADGFKSSITVNPERINGALAGYDSTKGTVENRLNGLARDSNLYAPSGTEMIFYQAAAPNGWVKVDVSGDHLCIISDTGGGNGGTATPTSIDFTHKHTVGDTQLDITQIPSHNHSLSVGAGNSTGNVYSQAVATTPLSPRKSTSYMDSAGSGATHTHTLTDKALTWSPRYFTCIRARKDGNRVAP